MAAKSRKYFRPPLGPATLNVLPEELRIGARPAFAARLPFGVRDGIDNPNLIVPLPHYGRTERDFGYDFKRHTTND